MTQPDPKNITIRTEARSPGMSITLVVRADTARTGPINAKWAEEAALMSLAHMNGVLPTDDNLTIERDVTHTLVSVGPKEEML